MNCRCGCGGPVSKIARQHGDPYATRECAQRAYGTWEDTLRNRAALVNPRSAEKVRGGYVFTAPRPAEHMRRWRIRT